MGTPSATAGCAFPTRVRFGVLTFACTLSLITYLDRVCISRVQEDIQASLWISPVEMGMVFSAFMLGYAFFEIPGGWMGDRWGSRRVLTRIVVCWSLFTALTGCVWWFSLDSGLSLTLGSFQVPLLFNSLLALLLIRFLFGLGEAGAYPNLSRVLGIWFPYRERGMANGAIWMSARLGGAIAPVVIGRLTHWLGWRQAFWVLGGIGVVWAAGFFAWFRDDPSDMPGCNTAERDLIRSGKEPMRAVPVVDGSAPDAAPETAPSEAPDLAKPSGHGWPPLGPLLRSSTMWAYCATSFGVSFGWYFYPTWQPRYLKDVFQISFEGSELLTGLPFLCGALGCLVGGNLSDRLVLWTGSRRWGRSLVGMVGFGGAGLCVLATGFTTAPWQAVTLLCSAFLITDLAIPGGWAVSADIGGPYVGVVAGIMNTVGAVGGLISPVLIPKLLGRFDHLDLAQRWQVIFGVMATAWFVAAASWFFIDASKPLFSSPAHGKA